MSVAAAGEGFIKATIEWSALGRVGGEEGAIETGILGAETIEGMVVEKSQKTLTLSPDGSVGANELDVYFFADRPVLSTDENRHVEIGDSFAITDYGTFKVQLVRYRPEGGYTKCTVRNTERPELN